MSELPSEPGDVHGADSEILREPGDGELHGEKLVRETDLTCKATYIASSENGKLKLCCTMKKYPNHKHYDGVFFQEWE